MMPRMHGRSSWDNRDIAAPRPRHGRPMIRDNAGRPRAAPPRRRASARSPHQRARRSGSPRAGADSLCRSQMAVSNVAGLSRRGRTAHAGQSCRSPGQVLQHLPVACRAKAPRGWSRHPPRRYSITDPPRRSRKRRPRVDCARAEWSAPAGAGTPAATGNPSTPRGQPGACGKAAPILAV